MPDTTETMVLPDSPEAAQFVTVSGWMSRDNRFWGDDERMARYCGSTHSYCEDCHQPVPRGYTICSDCRSKRSLALWIAAEKREWDGKAAIFSDAYNRYFWDAEDLEDFCTYNDIPVDSMHLYFCEPNYAHEIDTDYFADYLPEDGEVPCELLKAIDAFNAALKEYGKPISWAPGKIGVTVSEGMVSTNA